MSIYTTIIFLITYFICSINPAIIICKLKTGEDIRNVGSGNAGTGNAMRVLGKPLGTVVIILDIAKVFLSFAIVTSISKFFPQYSDNIMKSWFMVAAVVGHCYPIYYGFRGGKGVIVGITVAFILNFETALICAIAGLVIIIITRMVSMGTLNGTIMYIIISIFTMKEFIVPIVIVCSIIMFKHRANIDRIINHQENKLW